MLDFSLHSFISEYYHSKELSWSWSSHFKELQSLKEIYWHMFQSRDDFSAVSEALPLWNNEDSELWSCCRTEPVSLSLSRSLFLNPEPPRPRRKSREFHQLFPWNVLEQLVENLPEFFLLFCQKWLLGIDVEIRDSRCSQHDDESLRTDLAMMMILWF